MWRRRGPAARDPLSRESRRDEALHVPLLLCLLEDRVQDRDRQDLRACRGTDPGSGLSKREKERNPKLSLTIAFLSHALSSLIKIFV